jgi:hypothetical protein
MAAVAASSTARCAHTSRRRRCVRRCVRSVSEGRPLHKDSPHGTTCRTYRTVRRMGRSSTPAWSLWLPWRTPLATATVAHRMHTDDGPRIATREVPRPQCRHRSARAPLVSGRPHASLCAIRPSTETVGSRRGACENPSQESAHLCVQTCQAHAGAPRMRAHRGAVVQVRCSGCSMSYPRCPLHIRRHQTRSTSSCVLPSQWVPGSEQGHPRDDRVSDTRAHIRFAHACSSLEAGKAPRHARATHHVLPSVQRVCLTATGTQIDLCAPVQAGSGSDGGFGVTPWHTGSIPTNKHC